MNMLVNAVRVSALLALGIVVAGFAAKAAEPLPMVGKPARVAAVGDNMKPFLALRPTGGAYVAWAQKNGEKTRILLARTRDGVTVDPPVTVSPAGMFLDLGAENGPNVAVDAKGVIYVVWTAGSTPALPSAPKTRPKSSGDAGAAQGKSHGSGHPARPGNLNIWLARSEDDGGTFSAPVRVNDDPEGAEHRFPAVSLDSHGGICVAWLDKRKKTPGGEDLARVFFARSTDGGHTFGTNIDATAGQEYPICHCCRVAFINDPKQGLLIAYRNDIHDLRDMFLIRSTDYGHSFTVPMPLEQTGWKLPVCPMDGPSIGVDGAGAVHAVWMSGAKLDRAPVFGKVDPEDSKILYNLVAPGATAAAEPLLLGAGHHPRLTTGKGGESFVIWHDEAVLLARIGTGTKPAVKVVRLTGQMGAGSYPALLTQPDGSLLCAWQQLMPDDSVQIYLSRTPLSVFEAKR